MSQQNQTSQNIDKEILITKKLITLAEEESKILDRIIDYKTKTNKTFDQRIQDAHIEYSAQPPSL